MFFAWNELEPNLEKLRAEAIKISEIPPKEQTVYQRQVGELWKKVRAFDTLAALGGLHVIPPKEKGGEWRALGPAFDAAQRAGSPDPDVMSFTEVLRHYSNGDKPAFERAVTEHRARVAKVAPVESTKAGVEVLFNRYAPFFHLMGLYVLVFVLTICSFLGFPLPLRRSAWWVLILTIVLHTLGLVFRMYLQGRPPVTTLYSSAIFIAWGGVLLAMVVEAFFKNGLGLLVASVAGFMSLFIAHNLAMSDGDTLRELQAVLDTNFWLATHVVMITLGYAATFAAGLFAIVYVIRGVLTTGLTKSDSREMVRMTYGTICFAMLFSFVGTVLGGIWADQSWGRFWGWDPKENGAILIVLWNALILHSRWGGLVRDRGIMVLAIFGNIVTAWSWFGTNELGVGLHSYGFMEGTIFWLFTFLMSQLGLIFTGLLPMSVWRSGPLLEGSQPPALLIRANAVTSSGKTNPPRPDKGRAVGAT
jgi:ABC-type transport system involved in cytochrome c biogenesis permease subunit